MKILIAGYGFVGKAHDSVITEKHDVHIYDPGLGYTDWCDNPDGVIICVSTPPNNDGSCNIENVIDIVNTVNDDVPVLIKSTISLEGWRQLKFMFPNHKLAFSPEFLRAATAIQDFLHTRTIYIGGHGVAFWHSLFRMSFDDPNFTSQIADPEELILAKYFRNSFLATKVNFFNQIYDLCKASGVEYESVANIVALDTRIGASHIDVTPERGYGGHCFPKDTSAICCTAEKFNVDLTILKEAVEYNKRIRKE